MEAKHFETEQLLETSSRDEEELLLERFKKEHDQLEIARKQFDDLEFQQLEVTDCRDLYNKITQLYGTSRAVYSPKERGKCRHESHLSIKYVSLTSVSYVFANQCRRVK